MAWNSDSKKLAIKTIGTVESNLNYVSIYYADPITIGFMQNYGAKAAAILQRFRDENPSSWVGVAPSLIQSLNDHPIVGDPNYSNQWDWWTTRYLTRTEGESIKPVLNNNKAIQNDDAGKIIDTYLAVGERVGINKDSNTQSMIFFMVMYHQSPKRALSIISSQGSNASLIQLRNAALNEPVLGKYRNRYNTAYNLIVSGDTSGIDDMPGTIPEPEEGGDNSSGTDRLENDIGYLSVVGDLIHVHLKNGSVVPAYPTGQGIYTLGLDNTTGATVVPPTDNPEPTVPPSTGANDKQAAIVRWVYDRIGRYAYSQGPGRLNPEQFMRTDCSGLLYYGFQQLFGINIGTYTGEQYKRGQSIYSGPGSGLKESIMRPGDLVLNGNSSAGPKHVELYVGNSKTVGHGGPMNGPIEKNLSIRFGQPWIWVRRHL